MRGREENPFRRRTDETLSGSIGVFLVRSKPTVHDPDTIPSHKARSGRRTATLAMTTWGEDRKLDRLSINKRKGKYDRYVVDSPTGELAREKMTSETEQMGIGERIPETHSFVANWWVLFGEPMANRLGWTFDRRKSWFKIRHVVGSQCGGAEI